MQRHVLLNQEGGSRPYTPGSVGFHPQVERILNLADILIFPKTYVTPEPLAFRDEGLLLCEVLSKFVGDRGYLIEREAEVEDREEEDV
ncbi:hypothetical protein BC936DRAFT_143491 [Jimgerdemannia flammicorona]|uniref:Uncharacterized protein n=1 Tax=Jimgerdemannia flammicorona TaxID=994334 RepID=A0A433DDR9_9FUNG|nr:hypothetical protein BC936DRAFT_143491 [Jimgerdemannia flammicorona]